MACVMMEHSLIEAGREDFAQDKPGKHICMAGEIEVKHYRKRNR